MFDRATSVNAVSVLRQAIAECGKPTSIMTYHDAQSCATEPGSRGVGSTLFEKPLVSSGTRHVLSDVSHSQTNGKTGRFGEARARRYTFADANEIVVWRNTAMPPRSLNSRACETPCEVFEARMPPDRTEAVVDGVTGEACMVYRGPLLGTRMEGSRWS